MIGGAELSGDIGVIEGRQPAFMGIYMHETYQKQNIVSIYLECNMRERALRFLQREFGNEAYQLGSERLPPIDSMMQPLSSSSSQSISDSNNSNNSSNSNNNNAATTTTKSQYDESASIAAYGRYIAQLPLADVDRVARAFVDNQHRDQNDVDRYRKTYGIDYRDRSCYDIVIDMSHRTASENLKFCIEQLRALDLGLPNLIKQRL